MSFGAHQTFHIRDGWLRKGLLAISHDSAIFQRREAADVLGIGTNMVDALRFWMVASGLAVESYQDRWRVQNATQFGQLVMQHDPYFELEGTWWAIHAHVSGRVEPATTWYWFFNHYARREFDKAGAAENLRDWAAINMDARPSEKTLERDLEALLHTYVATEHGLTPEDTLECPLTSLELIVSADVRGAYRLQRPDYRAVPGLLVLWMLLDWRDRERPESTEVGLSEALSLPGAPGRVFNLDAARLQDSLAEIRDIDSHWTVRIVRTAGLDTLRLPAVTGTDALSAFYRIYSVGEGIEVAG